MKIGIDIDDTICKTYENNVFLLRKYNYKEKDCYDFKPSDLKRFLTDHLVEINELMEPKEYVSEVLNRLHEKNELIILSSRPDEELELTINFLKKYNIPYDDIYTEVTDKGSLAKSLNINIMIDDSEANLDSCDAYGIKCLKFGKESEKYKSFNSWLDIEKYIKEN